jgi:hypothetical protein
MPSRIASAIIATFARRLLVQLLEERREDDLVVAPEDRVDQRVLAIEPTLAWPSRARRSIAVPARRAPPRAREPLVVQLAHDGAEDVLLAGEVAVERAGRDTRLPGDVRDAGPPVAEGGEALLGGDDAGSGAALDVDSSPPGMK